MPVLGLYHLRKILKATGVLYLVALYMILYDELVVARSWKYRNGSTLFVVVTIRELVQSPLLYVTEDMMVHVHCTALYKYKYTYTFTYVRTEWGGNGTERAKFQIFGVCSVLIVRLYASRFSARRHTHIHTQNRALLPRYVPFRRPSKCYLSSLPSLSTAAASRLEYWLVAGCGGGGV